MKKFELKSQKDIETMKEGGKILTFVLDRLLAEAEAGISLAELDNLAERLIIEKGGKPSFQLVPGYEWSICTSVNDIVVHGVPNDYRLKDGDIIGIDCGIYYKNFNTDTSWTKIVGRGDDIKRKFLNTGKDALHKAIAKVETGNYIYDISKAIEETVEGAGYSVVRSLVGHGVGKKLHEEPEIPGFVMGLREDSMRIIPGMTLAIEVIYNLGSPDVVYKEDDGWTIGTKDGKMSGLFEATVAATSHGCLILTPVDGLKSVETG